MGGRDITLVRHRGKSPCTTWACAIFLCAHPALTKPTKHACGQRREIERNRCGRRAATGRKLNRALHHASSKAQQLLSIQSLLARATKVSQLHRRAVACCSPRLGAIAPRRHQCHLRILPTTVASSPVHRTHLLPQAWSELKSSMRSKQLLMAEIGIYASPTTWLRYAVHRSSPTTGSEALSRNTPSLQSRACQRSDRHMATIKGTT